MIKKVIILSTACLFFNNAFSAQPCGPLTPVQDSPFGAGAGPFSVAFSPLINTNTLYAAVANRNTINSGGVSVYSVDINTGVFTPIDNSGLVTGIGPISIAFSPLTSTGKLYAGVANFAGGNVSVYCVDSTSGVFTLVGSPVSTGNGPNSVAFSPLTNTGSIYAAVANLGDGTVSVFSVAPDTGTFTAVIGSPFSTGSTPGSGTLSIAFSPLIDQNTLYAAATNTDNTVSVFSVALDNGVFTLVNGSPSPTGNNPNAIAFSPLIGTDTLYAGVDNLGDGTVSVFSVAPDTGTFTAVMGSPFSTGSTPGTGPISIAFSPLIDQNTLYAATGNTDSTVSIFSVALDNGAFTLVNGYPSPSFEPASVAFSPLTNTGGVYAAVANFGANTVSVYSVGVFFNPTVSIMPMTQNVCAGGTINFTAQASGGSGTYNSYAWSTPGRGTITTTTANLSLPNAQPGDAGIYSVMVTDSAGCHSAASAPASVVIDQPTVFIPLKKSVSSGSTLSLVAQPSAGSGTYTQYAWSTPGRGTITTTTGALNLTNAQPSDAGNYTVIVTDSNGCNSNPSQPISVTVT